MKFSNNYFITIIVYLVSVAISHINAENGPIVKTPLGKVKGYFMKTREGRQISAFTAIPYSLPPTGKLRFKAPVPITPWNDILEANKETPICMQRNPYVREEQIRGQEDCLYLNIYTPFSHEESIPKDKTLPVMVFIHGGGWMCGDSTTYMYGPEYLLDRDVILVTTNYRLGPLGFLSTLDKHCPGNNGLKDQQEALRFIQKNIPSFGGNSSSVTIFGESAGGASAHYHMLSETSAGLFHKIISESGTAMVPWAEAAPGEALRNAFRLAKFLDCPQAPSKKMISCLRSKDSYDIINTEFRFYGWDYEPMTPFKAVVEPNLPGAFLTQKTRSKPKTPAVPWMTGLNQDEGCLKSVWITANETRFQEFVSGFESISPVSFYYENSPYVDIITKKIKKNYFKTSNADDIKEAILRMYSESYFDFPAVEAVDFTLGYSKQPIYLYQLTYRASNSFSQIFGDDKNDYGVCHADELMHLFPIHFLKRPFSEKDKEFSKLFVTLWTNFATSGDPTLPTEVPLKWEPTGKQLDYMDIGEEFVMKKNFAESSRFWGTLPLWHSKEIRRLIDEL